jgi:predicted RNA-binding Zn-ribbon protein involved in translation (DUF1610 family)
MSDEPKNGRDTRPSIRNCPVCGVAMISESDKNNPAALVYRCLSCGTVIVRAAPEPTKQA